MPACVSSHVRDETELTDFFFSSFRICDWLSYIAAVTLHYYPGCDIPQNQTTLHLFGTGRYSYTLTPTSSPYLLSLQWTAFLFVLVRFLSIRFGGRFQWNGRWSKLFHIRYMPSVSHSLSSLSYHTLATTCTVLRRSSGHQKFS
jgi:hypothetical protein